MVWSVRSAHRRWFSYPRVHRVIYIYGYSRLSLILAVSVVSSQSTGFWFVLRRVYQRQRLACLPHTVHAYGEKSNRFAGGGGSAGSARGRLQYKPQPECACGQRAAEAGYLGTQSPRLPINEKDPARPAGGSGASAIVYFRCVSARPRGLMLAAWRRAMALEIEGRGVLCRRTTRSAWGAARPRKPTSGATRIGGESKRT